VQGVGFRFFVREAAQAEGLGGWVRNLADGRVEAEIEGETEALDRVAGKLSRGPAAAWVDRLVVEELPPSGRTRNFEIR